MAYLATFMLSLYLAISIISIISRKLIISKCVNAIKKIIKETPLMQYRKIQMTGVIIIALFSDVQGRSWFLPFPQEGGK